MSLAYNEMIQVMKEGGLADVAAQLQDGPLANSTTPKTIEPTTVKCEFPHDDFPCIVLNSIY